MRVQSDKTIELVFAKVPSGPLRSALARGLKDSMSGKKRVENEGIKQIPLGYISLLSFLFKTGVAVIVLSASLCLPSGFIVTHTTVDTYMDYNSYVPTSDQEIDISEAQIQSAIPFISAPPPQAKGVVSHSNLVASSTPTIPVPTPAANTPPPPDKSASTVPKPPAPTPPPAIFLPPPQNLRAFSPPN